MNRYLWRILKQGCMLLVIIWLVFSVLKHFAYVEEYGGSKSQHEEGSVNGFKKGNRDEQHTGSSNAIPFMGPSNKTKQEHVKMKKDKKKQIEERMERLKRICKEFKDSYEYKHPAVTTKSIQLMQVSLDKHTLLWCSVLKAGFSNFRDTFNKLKAKRTILKIDMKLSHKKITNYTIRLLNVRNPWERLLSSYWDRIMTNHKPPTNTRNKWGRTMMAKYHNLNPKKIKYDDINVTFTEFLQYIVENPKHNRGHLEPHWMQYFESCKPCDVPYNFIVKTESLTEDAGFFFKQLGFNKNPFGDTERKNRAERLEKSYKDVPSWIMKRLITIYYWDFRLFGYDIEPPHVV
ncbi:unnamed protein product [Owenia fusiformis]|uniref:Carbohydrate sulfotransferase n=1 Tax=Owenia fusiformis TaxID=6347 RepID=A0A8J1TIY8_OWEFU|nr:unnamed protein product [Owenia fusiformis]